MAPWSVGFVSLGCAKNLVDSEHLAGILRAEGIPLARRAEEADVILVNTCAFVGDAKEESLTAILRAGRWKQAGRCRALVVAGCLAQRYRTALPAALPEVDAFIGLDDLESIGQVVRRLERGAGRCVAIGPRPRKLFEPLPTRLLMTGGPFAYLKIAEGCNHRCAFCAIPMIRGRQRSRRIADIVREAEHLLAGGVRELNLVAQDTTAYGRDRGDGTSLPRLLRALGGIGGRFWIRVLYGHPAGITDELLEVMGATRQVCRYLDVPIQHSHPEMLRAMHRAGTAEAVRRLPERIRAALPGVTLRTTCLVGFPGETAAHFADLLAYIRAAEFDHLGVFVYSPEEGTAGYRLRPRVAARCVARRRSCLLRAQQAIVRRHALARIGTTDVVLLLDPPTRAVPWAVARHAGQAPEVDGETRVRVSRPAVAGTWLRVRYTGAEGYDLCAEPLA